MSPQQIMEFGFTGKTVGAILKKIKEDNLNDEQSIELCKTWGQNKSAPIVQNSVLNWLITNPCFTGMGSNSDKRRWLENKSVLLNGQRPDLQSQIEFPIWELVFFPSSPNKITMV